MSMLKTLPNLLNVYVGGATENVYCSGTLQNNWLIDNNHTPLITSRTLQYAGESYRWAPPKYASKKIERSSRDGEIPSLLAHSGGRTTYWDKWDETRPGSDLDCTHIRRNRWGWRMWRPVDRRRTKHIHRHLQPETETHSYDVSISVVIRMQIIIQHSAD